MSRAASRSPDPLCRLQESPQDFLSAQQKNAWFVVPGAQVLTRPSMTRCDDTVAGKACQSLICRKTISTACVENPRVGGSIPPQATKQKPLSPKGATVFSLFAHAAPNRSCRAPPAGGSLPVTDRHRASGHSGREETGRHAAADSWAGEGSRQFAAGTRWRAQILWPSGSRK